MVDLAGASEPPRPAVGCETRWGLVARLCAAVAIACLFLLALYPWGGTYFPEGNWLRGPLWLLKSQSLGDNVFGAFVTVLLLPALFAWVVKRSPSTIVATVAGAVAWVAFGMWLAAMAIA